MLLAVAILLCAPAGEPFPALWSRLKSLPPDEACRELEAYLTTAPSEKDRRAALPKLRDLVTRAVPPLSPTEWWEIDHLRADNPDRTEILLGRRAVWVVTKPFAEQAAASLLVRDFDLAFVALRDLFSTDPIASRRHRFYIFPNPDRHGVLQIDTDSLRISLTWEGRDDAGIFEPLVHEMTHGFIADHPSTHLFAGGFGEGWCDFTPAYVAERYSTLGAPFQGRFDPICANHEQGGRAEYLDTRLPIEDVVAYGPSSALLVALTQTSKSPDGTIDWSPWNQLLLRAKDDHLPHLGGRWWPARQARDYLAAFGEARARPILRRWRFPLDAATQSELAALLAPAPTPPAVGPEVWTERNSVEGVRTLRGWKVLGPIPDKDGRRLEFDPIDASNFTPKEKHEYGSTAYAWRAEVKPDAYGTLFLDELPGGAERCTFYLLYDWPKGDPPPCDLRLASDDAARVWLDGQEVLRSPASRSIDVFDPAFALVTPIPGRHTLLVQVANDGGRSWFHMAAGTKPTTIESWKTELASADPARRLATVEHIACRRDARAAIRGLLAGALADAEPSVRAAAARGLGGHRDDPAAVSALIDRWRDPSSASFAAAIGELLLRPVPDVETARTVWAETSASFANWSFVECERVVPEWRHYGGFYAVGPNAWGGQAFGREWADRPTDWFAVTLTAREAAPRKIAVRYVQCDRDDAVVHVAVRRAERIVWQSDLPLPRTRDWGSFGWAEIATGALQAGRYDIVVTATERAGSPDFDVIGWK